MKIPPLVSYRSQFRALCALGLALPLGLTAQTAGTDAKKDDKIEKLQSFEVTGSRIKRIDAEGVSPVISITRQDIEISGFNTVGDVVRNLPFSNGTSVDPQFGSGFASGATSINLRGLGANNTLVLVNGRRSAPYGFPGGSGFTTLFDFNSIPLSAVESVEILKDGASALYGSDAVAGVVNIKLRTNYTGFSTSLYAGNTTNSDSMLKSFNATWGAVVGKTSVMITADWQNRNALFLRDRDFSASSDGRWLGGQDGRSTTGYPGYVVVPARDPSGRTPPAGSITGAVISPQGTLLTSPKVSDFARGASPYDFNVDTAMIPEYTYNGFYGRMKHEISDQLYAFGEVSLRVNTSHYEQAATPVVNTNENGNGANGVIRLPYNNPYNPFGVDIDNFRFRIIPMGPRIRELESTTTRYLGGVGGQLGLGDWTWESSLMYAENNLVGNDLNAAKDSDVQNLLNQTDKTKALNPFGPSAPGVAESLATTLNRKSVVDVRIADAQASGHIFKLPAGEIGVALGGEVRREGFKDRPDALAGTGGIVGSGGSSGLIAKRDVKAAYVEFSVPIWSTLEVQIAGRHERYSDFGTSDKPKYGLKYRPTKWLLLRGAFGQSFRAPDLTQLFTGQSVSFSNGAVADPLRPKDPVNTIRQISGGNPLLQPETTDSSYAGFVIEPPVVKGLELSVDVFRFNQSNLISQPSLNGILSAEGTSSPSGLVNRNPPSGDGLPGTINSVSLTFINVSKAMTDGIDFSARYTRPTDIGKFTFTSALTWTHSYEFNYVEFVKTNGFPMFRGNASVAWHKGNWGASVLGTYIDGYAEPAASAFGPGRPAAHRINHNYVFNPQVNYDGLWGTKITLGANNVFDRDPPHAFNQSQQYDNLQVSGEGRFVYIRISKEY